MSKIRLKKFGPVKEGYQENDGWLDIKKVTVFIGNQGSGKSTVAKVISTLTWLEKALNRGDVNKSLSEDDFYELFGYQRIGSYFKPNTEIEYVGCNWNISFKNGNLNIVEKTEDALQYISPKIMYVPAERNFLSTIENPFSIKNLPDTLRTFAEELRKGQLKFKNEPLSLPIGNTKYKYNENGDISSLLGADFEIDMLEASSGYQSFVPLYLVTKFLSDELQSIKVSKDKNDIERLIKSLLTVKQSMRREQEISNLNSGNLSEQEKLQGKEIINAKYLNGYLINIVEEPEQNLFPSSQWQMLQSLLGFNNINDGNKLIMTTHSPYIINYFTLAVKASELMKKTCKEDIKEKLQNIVPLNSIVNSEDLVIFELDEIRGSIKKLEDYKGLPSDENFLNENLGKTNDLFVELLKMEDLCR